jgi:hypothetical protein
MRLKMKKQTYTVNNREEQTSVVKEVKILVGVTELVSK